MSPLALELLRRLALGALVLATLLALLPRLLTEAGWLGPAITEDLQKAAHAVETARSYGASGDSAEMAAAVKALESARKLAAEGRVREARRTTAEAERQAVAAQRGALARREQERLQTRNVLLDVDRLLNDMEDLYDEVSPGLPRPALSSLVTAMKHARQRGAALFVAFEEERYADVLAGEEEARAALAEALRLLEAARRPPAPAR